MCGQRFVMGPVRLEILLFILVAYSAWTETTEKEDDDTERLPSKCEGIERSCSYLHLSVPPPASLTLGWIKWTKIDGLLDPLDRSSFGA